MQQSLISEKNKSKSFGSFGDLFDSWKEVKSVSGIGNDGVDVDNSTAEDVPEVLEDNSIGNVNNQVDDKYDISVNDELKSFKFKNIEDNNSLIFGPCQRPAPIIGFVTRNE